MTEADLKATTKEQVDTLLLELKEFFGLCLSPDECTHLYEETYLTLSLRFLRCSNLEKRLKGL